MPTNRTLVRIEVFFDPAKLGQKIDFKSPLRGQNLLFRQTGQSVLKLAAFCVICTKEFREICVKQATMHKNNICYADLAFHNGSG